MGKIRSTREEKIAWLLEHQDIWEGYPFQENSPRWKKYLLIPTLMKRAGLYSEKTLNIDINVKELIGEARETRRRLKRYGND